MRSACINFKTLIFSPFFFSETDLFPFPLLNKSMFWGFLFFFFFPFFCKMLLIYQKNHDAICDINFLTNEKPLCTAERHALWHVWNGDYESFLFIFFGRKGIMKASSIILTICICTEILSFSIIIFLNC